MSEANTVRWMGTAPSQWGTRDAGSQEAADGTVRVKHATGTAWRGPLFRCCSVVKSADVFFCMLCRLHTVAQLSTKTDASIPILSNMSKQRASQTTYHQRHEFRRQSKDSHLAHLQLPPRLHTHTTILKPHITQNQTAHLQLYKACNEGFSSEQDLLWEFGLQESLTHHMATCAWNMNSLL